jgi:hypothetical protein
VNMLGQAASLLVEVPAGVGNGWGWRCGEWRQVMGMGEGWGRSRDGLAGVEQGRRCWWRCLRGG